MANVTQQITNYLGGVSRLPDFNKLPGQVREIINGNPDLTYGLLKRPGTLWKFFATFPYNIDDYCFYVLDREGEPTFLIAVREGDIRVFNLDTGVTYTDGSGINVETDGLFNSITNGLQYDSSHGIERKYQFAFASDDQRTVICNRTKVTQASARTNNFFPAPADYRTVSSIGELPDTSVKKFYDLKAYSYDPDIVDDSGYREGWHMISTVPYDTRSASGNAREEFGYGFVMHGYILNNGVISNGGFSSGIPSPIPNIAAAGFNYYDKERLAFTGPNGMFGSVNIETGIMAGRVYHITGPTGNQNNTDKRDDYYMAPFSETYDSSNPNGNAQIRSFFWVEAPRWDTSEGLNPRTLPQELVYYSDTDTFDFKSIDYGNRWAGDTYSNPDPSFVGSVINNVFFHNNRLGFLSRDNVVLSRPIYYVDSSNAPEDTLPDDSLPDANPLVYRNPREIDFYLKSCIQVNDADPIDLKAANNNVSNFRKAISTPQGVILFSDGQQSLLSSQDGSPLTPANSDINDLGVFETDPNVEPVTMNSEYYFIDQNSTSGKLYRMATAGYQQKPDSMDVSTTVHDWIPSEIDAIAPCQTPGFIVLTRRDSNIMYIYKTKGEYQAWFKWEMPSRVVHVYSKHDNIYVVMATADNTIAVVQLETNLLATLNDTETNVVNKYLDMYFTDNGTISGSNTSIPIPSNYPNLTSSRRILAYVDDNSPETRGYFVEGSISGSNAVFPGDLTPYNGSITVGYDYDFEIELPRFFFQTEQGADYTAYLTIARLKFAVGLTGDFDFLVSKGGENWTSAYTTSTESGFAYAGEYEANASPITRERMVTVPIHERNTQFRIKLTSNSPYPLTLDSCMWEGNYSPRYYGRS